MTNSDHSISAPWLPFFVEIARTQFGLQLAQGRTSLLVRAVEKTVAELGLLHPMQLLRAIRDDAVDTAQVQAFLRNITVHESYFFRNEGLMQALRARILPELVARRRGEQRLRVWSAGCAGGEEVYTLSILIRESLPHREWRAIVLGTDIDGACIERARSASYYGQALRACTAEARIRYFETVDARNYVVRPEYREGVEFRVDNLVQPLLDAPVPSFDLILCRNVAIYFDAKGIEQMHRKIARYLAPDGLVVFGVLEPMPTDLFVPAERLEAGLMTYRLRKDAPGETGATTPDSERFLPPRVGSAPIALATKAQAQGRPSVTAPAAAPIPRPAASHGPDAPGERKSAPRARVSTPVAPAPPASDPKVDVDALYDRAVALANEARLDEAVRLAMACLEESALDPRPYLLAAIIHQELGIFELAETMLRQVLFLDPESKEAHFRLGMVLRRLGESDASERHFGRARRLVDADTGPTDAS